jgi:predicted RNase H-like HicB family nuclease
MKFLVTLDRDEAGFIVADCPSLPGCVSQGRTEAEAIANIREAIEVSLKTRHEHGIPAKIEVAEIEVDISY